MYAPSEGITHDFYFFLNSLVVSERSVQVSRVTEEQSAWREGLQSPPGHGARVHLLLDICHNPSCVDASPTARNGEKHREMAGRAIYALFLPDTKE